MMILGYMLAIGMGLTLGLIGAGGSILTVPIFVYLLDVKPILATSYSLLVVGSAALSGAIRYWRNDLVDIKSALIFAGPAMTMIFITRGFILPSMPDLFFGIPKNIFLMFIFAGLMLLGSIFMLRSAKIEPRHFQKPKITEFTKMVLGSASIGFLTGIVGAGGGFLIIPSLIGLFGLSMKKAVGTSLAIIAINSLVGFKGDLTANIQIEWSMLGIFLGLTLLGMWLGTTFSKKVESEKLKKAFGFFTFLIGIMILIIEIKNLYQAI